MKLTARARLREERARTKQLAFEIGELTAEKQRLTRQINELTEERDDWRGRSERLAGDYTRMFAALSRLSVQTAVLVRFVARSRPADTPAVRVA